MLRYLLAPAWWKVIHGQSHQLITGETEPNTDRCQTTCAFLERVAKGDLQRPFYLTPTVKHTGLSLKNVYERVASLFGRLFGEVLTAAP